MATTTTTTTPFLGCKISLISKSEIRYEGILYTIDPKESTIALAKVRSYGTEDRPAERQVPPREEIFEYIIFRAGDIKDLIVDDPPASIAPGLADPAIIQAHSTSSGATFPSTTFPQMSTNSNISTTSGQRSSGPAFSSGANAISSLTFGAAVKTNSVDSRSQNSTPTGVSQHQQQLPPPQQPQHRQSPHHEVNKQQSNARYQPNRENQRRSFTERSGGQQQQQQHQPQQQGYRRDFRDQNRDQNRGGGGQQNRRGSSGGQYNSMGGGGGQGGGGGGYRHNRNHSPPSHTNNRFGGSGGFNRQYNNFSSGGRRPPMQSRPQSQRGGPHNRFHNRGPKETLKFDSDYDFDKAEQDFKEMDEKMTLMKIEVNSGGDKSKDDDNKSLDGNGSLQLANDSPAIEAKEDNLDSEKFYNKSKSFFDSISCEAIEREKGNVQRIDWKAERKMNSETFGVPLSYRRIGFGGRGRYSGGYRGYSGGYRPNRGGHGRGGAGDNRNRFNGSQQRNRNIQGQNEWVY